MEGGRGGSIYGNIVLIVLDFLKALYRLVMDYIISDLANSVSDSFWLAHIYPAPQKSANNVDLSSGTQSGRWASIVAYDRSSLSIFVSEESFYLCRVYFAIFFVLAGQFGL